jgi:hypothetical protein
LGGRLPRLRGFPPAFLRVQTPGSQFRRKRPRNSFAPNSCFGCWTSIVFFLRANFYLRVEYEELKRRTLEGGSDEEILRWCFQNGRELNANDILIWNEFIRKRGWSDETSATLARRKEESGLSDRHEIQTMIEYFEFDEGRKA